MPAKHKITKAASPDSWVKVPDRLIRHIWRCSGCKRSEPVAPAQYIDSGVPYCGDCDTELEFVRTEINLPKLYAHRLSVLTRGAKSQLKAQRK